MTAIIQTRVSDSADHDGIRRVHEKSFGRKAEANLVETLLASDALIKELSIVAIEGEQIVGHILYTKVDIINDKDGSNSSQGTYAIALAPLAVLPEFQKKGIGKRLMKESIAKANGAGHGIIIVLGHPEYYPKFGFKPASEFGMNSPFDAPDDAFMALALSNYNELIKGDVTYHESFNQFD